MVKIINQSLVQCVYMCFFYKNHINKNECMIMCEMYHYYVIHQFMYYRKNFSCKGYNQ